MVCTTGLAAVWPRPVLLVYGEHDTTFPPNTPEDMLAAACQPKRMIVVPEAGHQNYLADSREYRRLLLDFFR